jgi:hypothetical protein
MGTAISGIQEGASSLLTQAGLAVTDAMVSGVDFALQKIETKDLSDEEIQEQIEAFLGNYGDAVSEAFTGFSIEDVNSYASVQQLLDPIGMEFAALASNMDLSSRKLAALNETAITSSVALAELAGGVDAFATKMSSFVSNFYSDAEQLQMIVDQTDTVFAGLGLSVPSTAEQFRALVLAQDLTTKSGREAYNRLLDMSASMGAIFDAAGAFTSNKSNLLASTFTDDQSLSAAQDELSSYFDMIGEAIPDDVLGLQSFMTQLADQEALDAFSPILDAWNLVTDSAADAASALADNLQESVDSMAALQDSISGLVSGNLSVDYDAYGSAYEAELAAGYERQAEIDELGAQTGLLSQILQAIGDQTIAAQEAADNSARYS